MKKIFLFLLALAFTCNNFSGLMAMEDARERIKNSGNFAQLPDYLILRIINNLPAKDIINFLATNKRFALLNKLLKNSQTPNYMGEDLRLFQQIQDKLATIKVRMLERDASNYFKQFMCDDTFKTLLQSPNLDLDTKQVLSQSYPIFEQTLRDSFGLTFIDYLSQLPDNVLINIFSNITDLRDLLNFCRLNNRFCYLITRLTPISLYLTENKYHNITQEHLIQILSHFKNIKFLTIMNNNINDIFITFLNNNCPNLTELYIYCCKQIKNLNFNCPYLTNIRILVGEQLEKLNLNCPNLIKLEIYFCNKINSLNLNCPNLINFALVACEFPTKLIFIKRIQEQYPKLKMDIR